MKSGRDKPCHHCKAEPGTLFRCRYGTSKDWVFLCEPYLLAVKAIQGSDYQYGGTWKRVKG